MEAIVNRRCPNCSDSEVLRAEEVRITAKDENDSDLKCGLCRVSTVWSCQKCGRIDGNTWYTDSNEVKQASVVPWIGEVGGADTCITVRTQTVSEIIDSVQSGLNDA